MAQGRRVAPGGRSVVALGLLAFLLVAVGVVARRSFGIAEARRMTALERQRAQLVARRTQLQRDIRQASSRVALMPIAEQRLGMRVPPDSQVVLLPPPDRAR
jgi:cell division protein FtsL